MRDRVKTRIKNIIYAHIAGMDADEDAEQILSDPNIAIVNRAAELPLIPKAPVYSDKPYTAIEELAFGWGAVTYRNTIRKAGWVKGVKDG